MDTNFPDGQMVVALGLGGRVRVLAVELTGPAAEAVSRHELGPGAAKRCAEGMVASSLLAAHVKGEERLTVDVQSKSPPFGFACDVNGDGTLRARFGPGDVRDQAEFFGMISAMKSLGRQQLYRGIAEVEGQTVEGALQRFLLESQQVDSRVRLLAELDEEGAVRFAAGILVEKLPACDLDEFKSLVDEPLHDDFKGVMTSFAFGALGGQAVEVLGLSALAFRCNCSRLKVTQTLRALGRDEMQAMIDEQGGAEVTCHYCAEAYRFDVPSLQAIMATVATG